MRKDECKEEKTDNAKTQARHLILAAAVALFAAILCLGLVGCGPSEEEKAKQALDAELSQFVNPSDDEASKLVGQMGGSDLKQLEQLGMDGESLFKSWVNGFAYEIGDVKVDGDTAKAPTKITSKQLYVVLTSWGDTFADDAMKQGFSTTDEIYAYAGKTFMAALDAATPVETEVTFTLTKDGKDWKLDMNNTDNQQALADSMFGGGISASEAFGS